MKINFRKSQNEDRDQKGWRITHPGREQRPPVASGQTFLLQQVYSENLTVFQLIKNREFSLRKLATQRWKPQSYLSLWEATVSKDLAKRKLSKPSPLKSLITHLTYGQLSKLPGKLFEKPASKSDPAASKGLSKAGTWALWLLFRQGCRETASLLAIVRSAISRLLDSDDCCLDWRWKPILWLHFGIQFFQAVFCASSPFCVAFSMPSLCVVYLFRKTGRKN